MSAFVLLSACAADSISFLPEDEFPAAMAEAECTDTSGCCAKAGYAHVYANCRTARRDYLKMAAAASKVAHAVYDGTAAFVCVAQLRAAVAACPSMKEQNVLSVYAGACAEIYRGGKTALSASCVSDWQCQAPEGSAGACLEVPPWDEANYACKVTITVGLGERAGATGTPGVARVCAPDLFPRFADDICGPRLAVGEDCEQYGATYGDTCERGATCDARNTGKCVTALPIGAECTDGYQCEGFACRHGHCALLQNVLDCEDDEDTPN